jgi:hypothetical protein
VSHKSGKIIFLVTCLGDWFFIRDTRWDMNFFTKFWMLFMLRILILCNERMCMDTWDFLPSKNTQHLCKCLHMAWHQMHEAFCQSNSQGFWTMVLVTIVMCWFGEATYNQCEPQFPYDVCVIGLYALHMEILPHYLAKVVHKQG